MLEATSKQCLRITLLHCGLSPPMCYAAVLHKPAMEATRNKVGGVKAVDSSDPVPVRMKQIFWRRFDIYPGAWEHRYRIGTAISQSTTTVPRQVRRCTCGA